MTLFAQEKERAMTRSTREICYAWIMGAIFGSALTGVIILTLVHGQANAANHRVCGQSTRETVTWQRELGMLLDAGNPR